MSSQPTDKRVVILKDRDELTRVVAHRFVKRIAAKTQSGKVTHVCLTGGTAGIAALEAIAHHARVGEIRWNLVHVWWGDERFVPAASDDRNELLARRALLDAVPIPAENIHAMAPSDGGADLDASAEAYAAELREFASEDAEWPTFEICFLGVGPDGHIASLFPDRPEIQIKDRSVVSVRNSPKPPPERISLTRPVINTAKRVWMVVSGADKAPALGLALAGASYPSVPVAGAKGRKSTVFFVDEAAAAEVPAELIEVDED